MKKNMRDFRQKKNLSMLEMSKKIGVSLSLYEKVELEQRTPSFKFINKFKKAFPEADTNSMFFS